MKPRNIHAIRELIGGRVSGRVDSYTPKCHDGQTLPSKEAIDAKLIELIADYDAQAYARNRQVEYPDWRIQLEKIYNDGLTKWKSEMVDLVKTKWPKDNSGPVE